MNNFHATGIIDLSSIPQGKLENDNELSFLLATKVRIKDEKIRKKALLKPVLCIVHDELIDKIKKCKKYEMISVFGDVVGGIAEYENGQRIFSSYVNVSDFSFFRQNDKGVIEEFFYDEDVKDEKKEDDKEKNKKEESSKNETEKINEKEPKKAKKSGTSNNDENYVNEEKPKKTKKSKTVKTEGG